MKRIVHASLFSGFGGPDLAAEWMGWDNAFHCEINEFCNTILECHFPKSKTYRDVTTTDFTEWRGRVDVLTGGFPCQPFSVAGARKGADDNRYLWPHFLRVIREIRPTWVIGENVGGILTMVQPGTEIEVGCQTSLFDADNKETILEEEFVVETICKDLEREGYSVQPVVIPACAIGAPHRRDRVFFIAHRSDAGIESLQRGRENGIHESRLSTYTDSERLQGFNVSQWNDAEEREIEERYSKQYSCDGRRALHTAAWQDFPTQPPVCSRDDGLSASLDGITFSKWRQESVKGFGNAIVPQVMYELFKAIEEIETKIF